MMHRQARLAKRISLDISQSSSELIHELLSNLTRPTPSSDDLIQLDNEQRIESLKKFHSCLKAAYSHSTTSPLTGLVTIEYKKSITAELLKNTATLSRLLVNCLIKSQSNLIRLLALKSLIFLAHLPEFYKNLKFLNITTYIVRIIDLSLTINETILSIEFIRLVAQLYPSDLTEAHFYCLLASFEDPNYPLNNLILETLLELACKRPLLACQCQIFTEIITYAVNVGNQNEFCIQVIIQTLLKCLDRPECRELIRFDDLFAMLIAPFVDFEYSPHIFEYVGHNNCPPYYTQLTGQKQQQNGVKAGSEPKIESILATCSSAILTIFNSYIGALCFSTGESYLIKSLLTPFSWFVNKNLNLKSSSKFFQHMFASSFHSNIAADNVYHPNSPDSKAYHKQCLLINRQMTILNYLVDMLYTLFKVKPVTIQNLIGQSIDTSDHKDRALTLSFKEYDNTDILENGFVNTECKAILDSFGDLVSQSDIHELIDEHQSFISSGPNLKLCNEGFLFVLFKEARLFECLLDLYFGLPVSFLQYSTSTIRNTYQKGSNLISQCQLLSYKVLNLFAELFYAINNTLSSENSIDNFNHISGHQQPQNAKNIFKKFYSQGVYTEFKRSALIHYLKLLDDQVKECEVITYLTDFIMRQENLKNGRDLPMFQLAKLSIFSQIFLNNSGFVGSAKFKAELEILQIHKSKHSADKIDQLDTAVVSKSVIKEKKKLLTDIEQKFHAAIDATLVLQLDSNITSYDPNYSNVNLADIKHFNWFETIKLFENFLLTESFIHSRFLPTSEAVFLAANIDLYTSDSKFVRFIKKLFEFFVPNIQANSRVYPSCQAKLDTSNRIATVGCYLIDFTLRTLNIEQIAKSAFEYPLIELLQTIKLQLSTEFFKPDLKQSMSNSTTRRLLTKDSVLTYYILFIGHLTSTSAGNRLLDSFKMHDLIFKIVNDATDLPTIKLIVSTFNFYMSVKARSLLEKCLVCSFRRDSSDPEKRQEILDLRIYILKLIFNMFRSNRIKFNAFFIDILINSLIEVTSIRSNSSLVDLNDEYVAELTINMIEYFFNSRPDLVDAYFELNIFNKEKILNLLSKKINKNTLFRSNVIRVKLQFLLNRFFLSRHFIESITIEEIRDLEKSWSLGNYDKKYFQLLERNIFNSHGPNSLFTDEFDENSQLLSNDSNQTNNNSFYNSRQFFKIYRRVGEEAKNESFYSATKADVYTPFHLNSAIIRLHAFEVNNFWISDKFQSKIIAHLMLIKIGIEQKNKETKLKQALWAVCSFLNCETGYRYLVHLLEKTPGIFKNLFEITSCIVNLAERHPILSIRATSFICLSYVSKTCTGANLIGKLGWHTFQPNCAIQTKVFYSVLSTFTFEQMDLKNFHSSLNLAIIFYNLNRVKTRMNMQRIVNQINLSDFSSEEKEFLDTQNNTDLMLLTNQELLRIPGQSMLNNDLFHQNFSLPIQVFLMSPSVGKESLHIGQVKEIDLPSELERTLNDDDDDDDDEKGDSIDEVKVQICQLIQKYLIMKQLFSVESTQISLIKLKLTRSDKFDVYLHALITKRLLSVRKIKFHMRKFIQELFYDMS